MAKPLSNKARARFPMFPAPTAGSRMAPGYGACGPRGAAARDARRQTRRLAGNRAGVHLHHAARVRQLRPIQARRGSDRVENADEIGCSIFTRWGP